MRKKLLSEAQVRRFQSLASIKPLNEMYNEEKHEDKMEETYGDKAHMKDDKAHMKHDAMEETAYKKEDEKMEALYEEEDDMDDDADVSIDEDLVEKFMEAAETIQEIADALGGEAGDMDDDDLGGDLDDEKPADDMDMGGDADDKPEPSPLEEEEVLEEALRGIQYIPSQKEIVSTVAQRVAKRLQEAKRAQAKLNKALGKRK